MTIYIVTSGSYSDYRIVAAFSDKEKAEAFASQYEDTGVEEYDLDARIPEIRPDGRKLFYVVMDREGNVLDCWKASSYEIEKGFLIVDSFLHGRVFARDREHAAKIMNEKRVQAIANEEWPDE